MPGLHVLAALGDVTIAVIAVAAIVLGVLLAARGPRENRVAAGSVGPHEPGPTPVEVPVAVAPDATSEGPPDVEPTSEEARAPAEPSPPQDPAWRVAARATNPAARLRRGASRIGGRAAGKRKDS